MHAAKTELGYFVNIFISSFIISPLQNSIWIIFSLSLSLSLILSLVIMIFSFSFSFSLNIFMELSESFLFFLFSSDLEPFKYKLFNSSFFILFCFKYESLKLMKFFIFF